MSHSTLRSRLGRSDRSIAGFGLTLSGFIGFMGIITAELLYPATKLGGWGVPAHQSRTARDRARSRWANTDLNAWTSAPLACPDGHFGASDIIAREAQFEWLSRV
jgi:hypothetical protein